MMHLTHTRPTVSGYSIFLWSLIAVDATVTFLPIPLPHLLLTVLSLLAELLFALFHGAKMYGWRAIAFFALIAIIVSNFFENLSIRTGVPFGDYHYTGELGPKVLSVPVLIGPAYVAVGYMAWVIATILLDNVHAKSKWSVTLGVSMIASGVMTAWDLAMDPSSSTIRNRWVWENGGGFFGVPISNYLGWTITTCCFYVAFALFLRLSKVSRTVHRRSDSFYVMPVAAYFIVAGDYIFTGLVESHSGMPAQVMDGAGAVWRTADVYHGSALQAIYVMGFIVIVAMLKIWRRDHPGSAQVGD